MHQVQTRLCGIGCVRVSIFDLIGGALGALGAWLDGDWPCFTRARHRLRCACMAIFLIFFWCRKVESWWGWQADRRDREWTASDAGSLPAACSPCRPISCRCTGHCCNCRASLGALASGHPGQDQAGPGRARQGPDPDHPASRSLGCPGFPGLCCTVAHHSAGFCQFHACLQCLVLPCCISTCRFPNHVVPWFGPRFDPRSVPDPPSIRLMHAHAATRGSPDSDSSFSAWPITSHFRAKSRKERILRHAQNCPTWHMAHLDITHTLQDTAYKPRHPPERMPSVFNTNIQAHQSRVVESEVKLLAVSPIQNHSIESQVGRLQPLLGLDRDAARRRAG